MKGVALAGMLPVVYTAYPAGVAAKTTASMEAADFIRYLTRGEATAQLKEAGIEPAH